MAYPRVELHPASVQNLKRGHPWVTKDRLSDNFPRKTSFLEGLDANGRVCAVLLNDPLHPLVKARFWSVPNVGTDFTEDEFYRELYVRIQRALKTRLELALASERENFYILFGEADFVPGLLIQKLADRYLIQSSSTFWRGREEKIVSFLKSILSEEGMPLKEVWMQERSHKQSAPYKRIFPRKAAPETRFWVKEFGLSYLIELGPHYDFGLYTDMSAIRKKLAGLWQADQTMLNLYSYTGAYSLLALKQGLNVTSVDLSAPHMDWLLDNIEENKLDLTRHEPLTLPTKKALSDLARAGKKFDWIICDPPSFSGDGKERGQALEHYKRDVPLMVKLLKPGAHLVLFLNTHSVSQKKFEDKIFEVIVRADFKQVLTLKLAEDCPTLKGYNEGNYIKGIVLKYQPKLPQTT